MARRARASRPAPGRSSAGRAGCAVVLVLLVASLAVLVMLGPVTLRTVGLSWWHRALATAGLEQTASERAAEGDLGYAGERLSAERQNVYLQLLEGARACVDAGPEAFEVYEAAPDDIDPCLRALMRDHPELFWLDGSCVYTYASLGSVVSVELGLTLPLEQVEGVRAQIEAQADAFLAALPADASEYDVARAAYEYVIGTTDYALDAEQNQNIQSVFVGHASVCAGYARAYQYLLQRAGLFCAYVDGSIGGTGEDHAWNLVRIDGAYAYVDPTWGDPTYVGEVAEIPQQGVNYDYLCLTTAEIERDDHVFSDADAWPVCDTPALDFYRRAGLCFDAYDEQALSAALWEQAQAGTVAAFKFADEGAYAAARDAVVAGSFLRDDLASLTTRYGYTLSDSLRVVKLYW